MNVEYLLRILAASNLVNAEKLNQLELQIDFQGAK